MLGIVIALLVLLGLTVLFVLLARRAWRAKHAIVKWPGVILAGLFAALFGLLIIMSVNGLVQVSLPRGGPVPALKVAGTPEQIARGQHLANSLCASCHTADGSLPLSGGRDVGTDSPLPIGSYWSINLTPAGPLKDWSDGEILRALREGADKDNHALLVMSSNSVRYLSEEDKQAVIAYVRSQPAIAKETGSPPDQPNLLVAILFSAGVVKFQPPFNAPATAPTRGETPEYGKYIVAFEDCVTCHGPELTGGMDPTAPHGPNLRVVQGWTRAQFISTLRTGTDPGGHALSDMMPWKFVNRLDDDELGALYAYLKSLPPAASQ
jgi:mono/diheme cytochrome c family protein